MYCIEFIVLVRTPFPSLAVLIENTCVQEAGGRPLIRLASAMAFEAGIVPAIRVIFSSNGKHTVDILYTTLRGDRNKTIDEQCAQGVPRLPGLYPF
jgi:hypothetical protein